MDENSFFFMFSFEKIICIFLDWIAFIGKKKHLKNVNNINC